MPVPRCTSVWAWCTALATLVIRMWQDLGGRLDVTIAALSGVIILVTLVLMVVMERATGLSRRLRQ